MSEPSFTSINLTSPDRLQGAICMRAILKCFTYLSILLVLLLSGLWQCWAELGRVASPTPCMVRKPASRLVSPQVFLPSFNPLSEGSSRTPSIFPHLHKADYIPLNRVRIWKASITHLYLSDFARRAEGATLLRACRPSSQDVRALLPPAPTAPYNEPAMKTGAAGRACQDITLDVSATSAGLQLDWPH